MTVESLQRVFKTFLDPTRVRILALLEREELAVQELMDVLDMAQSRVSRHLAILREAALIEDRRDGTYVFYRFRTPDEAPWRDIWDLVTRSLKDDPSAQRDRAALEQVLSARVAHARSFFDSVGAEWDAVRKVFNDDALRAQAISRLVAKDLRVLDVGTGTGILAIELARLGLSVIAMDNSARMLDAAREKIESEGLTGIELRHGEAGALPVADGEVDAALIHMVLHYLSSPGEAIREMARAVKPGGTIAVIDFVRHNDEWMRQELGVTWLGFDEEEIRGWTDDAALTGFELTVNNNLSASRKLPATFIATARRPA